MQAARPYAQRIRVVVAHLVTAYPEYRHPFMIDRPVHRVGYLVVTTDRGLCGGLNINLFRTLLREFRQWHEQGVEIDACLIGKKAVPFLKRLDVNVVAAATGMGDLPDPEVLRAPVTVLVRAFYEGKIDRLLVACNQFVNTMTQRPRILQLLPGLADEADAELHKPPHWDYIYEPDARSLLNLLLVRYLEALVYRAVVENMACEMAARMVAMKSASDNAVDLISQLQLVYNKARQAAITQEIAEIVGGAAAV